MDFGNAIKNCYAGINLTGYHPPRAPRGFRTEMCAQPRAFAQQKMPGGRATKGWCPWGRAFAPTGFQTWKLLTQLSGLKNWTVWVPYRAW